MGVCACAGTSGNNHWRRALFDRRSRKWFYQYSPKYVLGSCYPNNCRIWGYLPANVGGKVFRSFGDDNRLCDHRHVDQHGWSTYQANTAMRALHGNKTGERRSFLQVLRTRIPPALKNHFFRGLAHIIAGGHHSAVSARHSN